MNTIHSYIENRLLNMRTVLQAEYPGRYPEITAFIDQYIQNPVYPEDKGSIADAIFRSDRAEPVLPPVVSDFLMDIYHDLAEDGNAGAMCNIGALYKTGRCGAQDDEKAVYWYSMSAAAGNLQATENLGYCYYYGFGTAIDYERAYVCFTKAALGGLVNSVYKVGDLYRYGYYVDRDPAMAFHLYTRAAMELTEGMTPEIGADIFRRIGDCYYEAIGTGQDYSTALSAYQRAESLFYPKLSNGDDKALAGLNHVLERQALCRRTIAQGIKLLREL